MICLIFNILPIYTCRSFPSYILYSGWRLHAMYCIQGREGRNAACSAGSRCPAPFICPPQQLQGVRLRGSRWEALASTWAHEVASPIPSSHPFPIMRTNHDQSWQWILWRDFKGTLSQTWITWKQCCGSVTFWYGSGSADPYHWLTDPDSKFFCLILFEDTLTSVFSGTKSKRSY